MAEKLSASCTVLETLMKAEELKNPQKSAKKSDVALQFPEDFFQEPRDSLHRQETKQCPLEPAKIGKQPLVARPAAEVIPESQLKLHQSILNFKQFNVSLKPLLAILEFLLVDASQAEIFARYSVRPLTIDLVDLFKELGRENSLRADRFTTPKLRAANLHPKIYGCRVRLVIIRLFVAIAGNYIEGSPSLRPCVHGMNACGESKVLALLSETFDQWGQNIQVFECLEFFPKLDALEPVLQ